MRQIIIFCIFLLGSVGGTSAHTTSGTAWSLLEYDGDAILSCADAVDTVGCDVIVHPCESAFGLPIDADLTDLPEVLRHDMTACFMAYYDQYEVALWNIAPGSDPDPMIARNANSVFNSLAYRHHRNAPGECRSSQDEKTEDWRCALREVQGRLVEAVRGR